MAFADGGDVCVAWAAVEMFALVEHAAGLALGPRGLQCKTNL